MLRGSAQESKFSGDEETPEPLVGRFVFKEDRVNLDTTAQAALPY